MNAFAIWDKRSIFFFSAGRVAYNPPFCCFVNNLCTSIIGASSINLTDERRTGSFQRVLSSDPTLPHQISWADLSWGLREDVRTLDSSLPQPFQASVFMTPGWSMTNLGIQSAEMVAHDLSWIWLLLDYFKSYFTDPAFGNPGFEAQKWSHRIKNALRRSTSQDVLPFVPLPGLHVDFRLWLCRPILCLPSDYFDSQAPSLIISSDTGLWYRYKSIEQFSSQEIVSTDMNLSFANEFLSPERFRKDTGSGSSGTIGLRPLIEGLSFGLRYDCNNKCNHKDVSVIVPFLGENIPSCSVVGQELEVEPIALAPPKVLKPFQNPTRQFGNQSCDITCVIEAFPITSATMKNFFSGPSEVNKTFAPQEEDDDESPPTFSVSAKVGDVRMFLIDPDLGKLFLFFFLLLLFEYPIILCLLSVYTYLLLSTAQFISRRSTPYRCTFCIFFIVNYE